MHQPIKDDIEGVGGLKSDGGTTFVEGWGGN